MTTPLLTALVDGSHPAATLRFEDAQMSHADFRCAATAIAHSVAGLGRVAVLGTPTLATALAVTGAMLAGTTVVPVPADSGQAEIDYLVADSGAQAWVGPAAPGSSLPALPVDPAARADDLPAGPRPDSTATILYTSGTTGPPKGVLLSRKAIGAGLDGLADAWAWTAADTLVHGLPLFHTHGLIIGVLGPLHIGCSLVHTGRPTPQRYAAAAGSMYFGVPTVWSRVAHDEESARALAGARAIISGSAALPAPVFERIRDLTGQAPIERYGMSETLLTVSNRADDAHRLPGHVGWPITGVQTRLVRADGMPVPHDGQSVGQLQVRGATLFDGYLGRPDATAASWTEDGWFRTGDVATIAPDGNHRIVGRESIDLIKTGGYRVGAGEIETELLGHPAVRECAVIGVPDEDLGQRIVAVVVRAGPVEAAELVDWVATRLSAHKRPREVRFVDALPLNPMGKVQKKELLDAD
ncbi:MAG: acyl-CoA synthetase [Micrococcales bacterium]|nr:acyl-CoA synthetase [Micrococcales bacterium]